MPCCQITLITFVTSNCFCQLIFFLFLFSEYSQFFSASIKENTVQLILLGELPDNVISENNVIALQVVAFSNFNRASTIVILRIVRDDDVAPLFSSPLYRGSYQIETGLTHEPITLTQGYHETIVSLSGGNWNYTFHITFISTFFQYLTFEVKDIKKWRPTDKPTKQRKCSQFNQYFC